MAIRNFHVIKKSLFIKQFRNTPVIFQTILLGNIYPEFKENKLKNINK